jgi:hypothetical protein
MRYKQRVYFYTVLLGVIVSLSACHQQKNNKTLYFPIDSLLRVQVYQLTEAKAQLNKQAEINGQSETKSIIPTDTTAWQHELDIFFALNTINKSINAGSYVVESNMPDVNSNLLIKSFSTTKDLPVKYLKVYYLDTPSNIKKIEALYHEENSLLKGSRQLILEFKDVYNKVMLIAYSIEGGQKMFLGDSVQFSVKCSISFQ